MCGADPIPSNANGHSNGASNGDCAVNGQNGTNNDLSGQASHPKPTVRVFAFDFLFPRIPPTINAFLCPSVLTAWLLDRPPSSTPMPQSTMRYPTCLAIS